MKATIVDLRYRMKDILKALERKERVTILYHGREKGTIIPAGSAKYGDITTHPFFGMSSKEKETVKQIIDNLRESRVNDI